MRQTSCVVIDYGIGNVFSVMQSLVQCGITPTLSSDRTTILAADRVIFPGVGAFGRAANMLKQRGLDDTIYEFINKERPFLGICVGMQLMMEEGYEFGLQKGLGIFKGKVDIIDIKDDSGENLRVPLIGWNTPVPTTSNRWQNTPFAATAMDTDYYFVHSYEVQAQDPNDVAATVSVGTSSVTAAIHRDHIMGVQFHPEKSALGGQQFLKGFLAL